MEYKKQIYLDFLTFVTPGTPLGSLKKIQPIWSNRLAGYREHIYECLVLIFVDFLSVLFQIVRHRHCL